jgi:hypothetical protein
MATMTIFSFWAPATTCTQYGLGIMVESLSVRKQESRRKDKKNFHSVFLDSWRWSISFRTPFVKDLLKLLSPLLSHSFVSLQLILMALRSILHHHREHRDSIARPHTLLSPISNTIYSTVRANTAITHLESFTLVTYSFHPKNAPNESHTQYQDH